VNSILIKSLRLSTRIGVPEDERATPQTLELDVEIVPLTDFHEMRDDVARTVDYAEVQTRILELAAARPRRLIETLANDVARLVLRDFAAASATVTIRKFILPDTAWVGVTCSLSR
jgi:7,8-dihydroneopterin aldolase/epimerase/oxygenase